MTSFVDQSVIGNPRYFLHDEKLIFCTKYADYFICCRSLSLVDWQER